MDTRAAASSAVAQAPRWSRATATGVLPPVRARAGETNRE
jgi:hypothetical protein